MRQGGLDAAFRPADSLLRALGGEPVRVGTRNPAKLEAVRSALAGFAADPTVIRLEPVDADSGVAEQPIGWAAIVAGARNRAHAALRSGDGVLAIGIEDGLVRLAPAPEADTEATQRSADATRRAPGAVDPATAGARDVFNLGCAWISDGEREGHGFSSGFRYPPECLEPALRDGAPIGDLFDALWRGRREHPPEPAGGVASGRRGGNIGLLTQGRLDRSAYGAQAVVCALIRFLHTDLYDWSAPRRSLGRSRST